MLYDRRVIMSLALKVKLPMILEIDNSGTIDLANSWSAGGRTRHMETKMFFLRDLKEAGILETKWLKGTENPVDMYTKNLGGPDYNKCTKLFVGEDKYSVTRLQAKEIVRA